LCESFHSQYLTLLMIASLAHTALLIPHPVTLNQAVRCVQTHVRRPQDKTLAISFALEGDLSKLSIPQPKLPRRGDYLWQHSCFEAFVAVKGEQAYHEFNFAPSGEWAAYAFHRYRDGGPLLDKQFIPQMTVRSTEDRLELDAVITLDRLSSISPRASLLLALSAVIEDEHGALSYWALKHAPGKPDFHHPDTFALELEAPLDAASDFAYTKQR
jgi:hypothetical protein